MSEKKVHSFFQKHIRIEVSFAVRLLKMPYKILKGGEKAKRRADRQKICPLYAALQSSPFINPFIQSIRQPFYPVLLSALQSSCIKSRNPAIRLQSAVNICISLFFGLWYNTLHISDKSKDYHRLPTVRSIHGSGQFQLWRIYI